METGEEYGPIPKRELDQWLQEGRLTADCQVLKEGAAQWQWASDVYPSLTSPDPSSANANTPAAFATNNQPFDFAANNAAPTSPSSTQRRARRSPQVDLVAMANYSFAGLCFLRFFIVLIIINAAGGIPDIPHLRVAIISRLVGHFLGSTFAAVFYLVAGIGVAKRQQWGRVMTLIIAALTGFGGLAQMVLYGAALATNYELLETVNAVPMTLLNLLTGIMSFSFAIFCYAILLSRKASKEFKRVETV